MLYAVAERCPVFGGKVASFDATDAKAVPGVKHVVQISTGVAVVADNTWSANEGRKALQVSMGRGRACRTEQRGDLPKISPIARRSPARSRAKKAMRRRAAGAAKKLEAVYEAPYLAHAPMEPLNCTADVRSDSCEVWASTQGQSAAFQAAIGITGLKPEQVKVHTLYMGGGFGRRARNDYVAEAVEVSKAVGAPVQLTWMREDDMQQDWYRPASYTHFAAGLDSDGGRSRSRAGLCVLRLAASAMACRARPSRASRIWFTVSPTFSWTTMPPIPGYR